MSQQIIQFGQILGQDSAIEALTTAYRLQRLPHALVFAGPVGVGKATTARALAGLFLCEKPKEHVPCGRCASCRAFDAGNHPDYHIIYRQLVRLSKEDSKAKELSADVIREFLLEKAGHSSVVGVGKVFVIEEADLMSITAQNAMLKTLEEPAGRTLIILLTDQPDGLLATIRSRSRLVRFSPLDEKTLREQLVKRGIAPQKALEAARFADGSLGLALRWIEDGVIDRASELALRLERISSGGGKGATELQDWFKSAADAYAEKQVERDDKTSLDQAKREGLALYLKLCADFFRRRLIPTDRSSETLERTCSAIDAVARSEAYLESNVNMALVLQQFTGSLERSLSSSVAV
jgi:DNA polymerase III subunit delta'